MKEHEKHTAVSIGAHMSVSGGLHKAIERIMQVNGRALQIFTRNQRQWKAAPVTDGEAALFAEACAHWGAHFVASHASYLINLGSPDEQAAARSVTALAEELVRAESLHIPCVVLHPGAHMGRGTEAGCERVAERLAQAAAMSGTSDVRILLENTAGQGTSLGADIAELGRIIKACPNDRVGMCLDTAHAHAAGYDLAGAEGHAALMEAIACHVGMDRLSFIHLNDSKTPSGSRVDRHAHIGDGHIGRAGFARLLHEPLLRVLPMVLETPKDESLKDDRRNLALLRELAAE